MDRGTYAGASAGLAQLRKLDIVSNNLANVNTPGFKKQILVEETQPFADTFAKYFQSVDPFVQGDHDRTPGVVNFREVTDFSRGQIEETRNPLDAALQNEHDFFVVQTPDGMQYTRAGNFTLDADGKLSTSDGMIVQGDGGEISATGADVHINPDGSVASGKNSIGRLQVVRFDDPGTALTPAGSTRFKLAAGVAQPQQVEAEIIPGSLELANVTSVASVVDLITVNRAFDLYTKTAQAIDDMNTQAISRYGSRR